MDATGGGSNFADITASGTVTAGTVTATGTVSGADLAASDDLTVGDDAAVTGDLTAGTLALGGGNAVITKISKGTASLATDEIPDGAVVTQNITVTGALTQTAGRGALVVLSRPATFDGASTVSQWGIVTAADTVTLYTHNVSGGVYTPGIGQTIAVLVVNVTL